MQALRLFCGAESSQNTQPLLSLIHIFSGAIVEIPITGSDIVKAIAQCRKNTNCQKIGLIGDYSNMKDIQSMSSLFNINFVVYVIDNPDQIEDMVKRAIEEGCDALISGSHANKLSLIHI